jgi:DMSO/TMAO reductase YedYZ molybdopterin-dependent catalytic subunit
MSAPISRRRLLNALTAAGSLALSGCGRITQSEGVNSALERAQAWNRSVQRWLLGRQALAAEFGEHEISREFRANGTTDPGTEEYGRLARGGFADYRLVVDGLVEQPLSLSLKELRGMPARTQITRHDCVEGWSCIAKWSGVRLTALLERAHLKPSARYIAFHCADNLSMELDGTGQYYETIDLIDAVHPQTILAYDMNGAPLTIPYGAPLRLRLERQLGYKMAKYVMRIEVIESFQRIGRGQGGYWEDRGYQWYAGI